MAKPIFTRPPKWRMVLVAIVAWLVLSAWMVPEVNPFRALRIGADAETGSMLAMVRRSQIQFQEMALDYRAEHQRWPQTPLDLFLPDDNGMVVLTLPRDGVISVRVSGGFDRATGLIGTELVSEYDPASRRWRCRPGQPSPPEPWLFDDCRATDQSDWSAWTLALIGVLALIPIIWVWLATRDPLLASFRANPRLLRQVALDRLPAVDWRLRALFRRSSTLAVAEVSQSDWRDALSFASLPLPERLTRLAQRVAASANAWPHGPWPGCFQLWQLPPKFPIALERVLVYLPSPELGHRELLQWLRHQRLSDDVLLVISPNASADVALNAWAMDPGHVAAYASQSVLSDWLLSADAESVLVRLFARQLPVTRISPYQTRGGITRASGFFGRQQELSRILNREPSNYLLVGGRQLGKTSLMKAVERHYQGHPEVRCLYVSLRDHRLRARLAQLVEAGPDASLVDILGLLQAQRGKSRLLLLLDECDLFLRDDARTGYPQLSELRAQSEEGRCRFILAGFWDLYEAVALDFASPIRNFGEVIRLGPLDEAACLALVTEPMQRLGLGFENAQSPKRIAEQCGGRANLIAIVCQYLLERSERHARQVGIQQVEDALRSEAVQDALTGWSKLSPSAQENKLDRALVYQVASHTLSQRSPITLAAWLARVAEHNPMIEFEAIRQSMMRLQIAYVIQRASSNAENDDSAARIGLIFAVPLQMYAFDPNEAEVMLRAELESLRL